MASTSSLIGVGVYIRVLWMWMCTVDYWLLRFSLIFGSRFRESYEWWEVNRFSDIRWKCIAAIDCNIVEIASFSWYTSGMVMSPSNSTLFDSHPSGMVVDTNSIPVFIMTFASVSIRIW